MADRIVKWSGMSDAWYLCVDCHGEHNFDESYHGRNALGLAKQHAQRYGHSVVWGQEITGCYTPEGSEFNRAKHERKAEQAAKGG